MIETYELAVIGAGPAGLQAAIHAAKNGVKTVLVDSFPQAGGQYLMQLPAAFQTNQPTKTEKAGESLIKELISLPVTRITNALTWSIFKEDDSEAWLVALYGKDSPNYIRAQNLILATGAYDTPLPFPGWTLPGVITCGAALILLKSQRIKPGTRAVVTGTGPLILSVSAHLVAAGVDVVAVCESNHILPKGFRHSFTMLHHWHRLVEGAKYLRTILQDNVPYKTGWSILAVNGKDHVEEAIITKVNKRGQPIPGKQNHIQVDLVVSGYSLTPNTGLARLIGCQFDYKPEKGGWVPLRKQNMESSLQGVYIIGDGAGIGGAENALVEGQIAGIAVSLRTGHLDESAAMEEYKQLQPKLKNQQRFGFLYGDLFTPQPGLVELATDQTILCRCEEVTLAEIKKAVALGAKTIGEVKMLTRCGMGNCQGRMCEHGITNAIVEALSTELQSKKSVGFYTVRPPLHPIPESFLAEAFVEIDQEIVTPSK